MSEQEAINLVERKRSGLGITQHMSFEGTEKAIVQYKKHPERPGPAEDRLAWIITYASALQQVVVHVDDQRGRILTVKRIP